MAIPVLEPMLATNRADLEAYFDAHHVEPGTLSRLYTPTVERREDQTAD